MSDFKLESLYNESDLLPAITMPGRVLLALGASVCGFYVISGAAPLTRVGVGSVYVALTLGVAIRIGARHNTIERRKFCGHLWSHFILAHRSIDPTLAAKATGRILIASIWAVAGVVALGAWDYWVGVFTPRTLFLILWRWLVDPPNNEVDLEMQASGDESGRTEDADTQDSDRPDNFRQTAVYARSSPDVSLRVHRNVDYYPRLSGNSHQAIDYYALSRLDDSRHGQQPRNSQEAPHINYYNPQSRPKDGSKEEGTGASSRKGKEKERTGAVLHDVDYFPRLSGRSHQAIDYYAPSHLDDSRHEQQPQSDYHTPRPRPADDSKEGENKEGTGTDFKPDFTEHQDPEGIKGKEKDDDDDKDDSREGNEKEEASGAASK